MNKLSLIKPYIKSEIFNECFISSITDDSRDVQKNSLFIARKGVSSHGKDHLRSAIKRGASCIITSDKISKDLDIPIHHISDLEDKIVEILFSFHALSHDNFIFYGVTGTNGKTTTAFIAHNILRQLGRLSIYIGTLGAFINDSLLKTKGNTTPGIFEIFEILAKSNFNQKAYVFIEVSSHALSQKRLCNLLFSKTIILNIQSDHLDYHKKEKNYIDAKLSIININNLSPTIVCIDELESLLSSFSNKQKAILSKSNFLSSKDSNAKYNYLIDFNPQGLSKIELNFPDLKLITYVESLLRFNIKNFISAIALISDQISSEELNKLQKNLIKLPAGRGEILEFDKGKILIDFAHDSQSMWNILSELALSFNEIILVFGCGGDRDKSKRSKMMEVAQKFAKKIYFTSDNNRNESFASIVSDAIAANHKRAFIKIIEDRKEAISLGLEDLNKENLLVILGKGHEDYIEISGKKIPFNDKKCVLKILSHEID
ncbi:MAG: hypothetical protein CMD68_05370 [Gammaproteobacteria bacterium]|nr:hypothetical protein [Gammaproteobacteria bacterium]